VDLKVTVFSASPVVQRSRQPCIKCLRVGMIPVISLDGVG
jgi:hypothetical protein